MGIRCRIYLCLTLAVACCGLTPRRALAATVPRIKPTTIPVTDVSRVIHLPFVPGEGGNFYSIRSIYCSNLWAALVYLWPEIAGGFAVLAALIMLRRLIKLVRQRRTPGVPYCRKCNYNLTALPSDRCPECGTSLTPGNRVIGRPIRRRVIVYAVLGGTLLLVYPVLWIGGAERHPAIANRWQWDSQWLGERIRAHWSNSPSDPPIRVDECGDQIVELDRAGRVLRGFDPVDVEIQLLRQSPDGTAIIGYCGGPRGSPHHWLMWDVATGRRVRSFHGPGLWDETENNIYQTDGQFIYFRHNHRCDAKSGTQIPGIPWRGMSDDSAVLAAPGCPSLVVMRHDGTCHILDSAGNQCLSTLPSRLEPPRHAFLSPNGHLLLATNRLNELQCYDPPDLEVWDIAEHRLVRRVVAPANCRGPSCELSAKGQWWIHGEGDWYKLGRQDLVVCDAITGQRAAVLDCEGFDLRIWGTSRDGRFLFCTAAVVFNEPLLLYDLSSLPQSTP